MPLIMGGSHRIIIRMTRLQISRLHLGWSIVDLAIRSGISVETIEKHEKGVRNRYAYDTIRELTRVLGAQHGYLAQNAQDIWEGDSRFWRKQHDGWLEVQIYVPVDSTTITTTTIAI